ncbi:hypothetical protein [Actomonas aquatica]|uniref:GH26 domain-containing protein n=1 Tax=Actomonas aquatica TaxID=2866162 RepID=A0ABZ1C2B2_9BACT|nr:hypothetical protein [Opitutus sp. WL0086]WRQ85828.1 hypothetical protein K1X11_013530 [Opitutus sp. WL0086]
MIPSPPRPRRLSRHLRLLPLLVFLAHAESSPAPTTPAYAPRVEFGARLEPHGTILHGAGQDPGAGFTPSGFIEYAEAIGPERAPALFMTYIGLGQTAAEIRAWGRDLRQKLAAVGGLDLRPQIGLALTSGREGGTGIDDEVAAGHHDDRIAAFVAALAALDRPAYVRIGYECEGSWNGYRPDTYRTAFVRITSAIRHVELPVATVWCVAGGSSGATTIDDLLPYYPGDDWVDWWSIDLFPPVKSTRPSQPLSAPRPVPAKSP